MKNVKPALFGGYLSFALLCMVQRSNAQQCGITQYTVTCDTNSQWDELGWKRCIPQYCTVPDEFPNGRMTPTSSRIFLGDRLRLECNAGYELSGPGSPTPKCLDNCSLEEFQTCERRACPSVIDEQGSGLLMNQTVYFGDIVTIQCNENYRSSESDTVFNHACDLSYTKTCNSDGALSPVEARCIPVSCPPYDPEDRSLQCLDATCGPAYGTVVGQVDSTEPTALGETVSISCFQGYRLRGETSNKPQCSANCQYTTGHQACTPRLCPEPSVPANARVEASDVPYASSTSITCNGGFVVRGSTPSQCNRSVEVTCMLVASASTDSDIALQPALDNDLCMPAPCPAFELPANAAATSPDASTSPIHGQELTVRCREGFRAGPVLDALAACDAAESYAVQCLGCDWQQLDRPTNNPLACLPISCSPPGDVPNGVATPNTSVALGAAAVITCDEGYRVNSNDQTAPRASNVTCLPACNYSVPPTCLVVECTSASAPDNGVLVISGQEAQSSSFASIQHSESITIKCNTGYMVEGSACLTEIQSTCWDGDFAPRPTCSPQVCGCSFGLPCEEFKEDPNAVQGNEAKANGSIYEVTCQPGFRAVDDSRPASESVSCAAAASYSSQCVDCTYVRTSRCAATSCGAYAAANASAASTDAVLSGQTVDVTCSLGFRPNSTEASPTVSASRAFTATCGADCTFAPPTDCVPIQCPEAPAGNFSTVTSGGTGLLSHTEEVTVTCDSGYYVAGTVSCQKVFTVTCFDGALVNKQTCSPITASTCGCGVGNCLPYARLATEESWEPSGNTRHGAVVTITCGAGFRAGSDTDEFAFCTDPETRSATCSDCEYLSNEACLPIACPPFAPGSSVDTHSPTGPVQVGNQVTGTCAAGFRYKTTGTKAFTASCGAECSYFLDATTVCEAIKCPTYTPPANSEVLPDLTASTRLDHQQVMQLRCLPGFTVNGSDCQTGFNVTCVDGELVPTPAEPSCVPARCGCGTASCPLWRPTNASLVNFEDGGPWVSGSVAHGTRISLTCNSGFRPAEGESFAECEMASRVETECNDCVMDPDIRCLPISCGSLALTPGEANHTLEPPDALGTGGRVQVDTAVTVSCPDGFRLGTRQATQPQQLDAVCQSDCTFSVDSVPACLRVACPDFTLPSNSKLLNGSGAGWSGMPQNGPSGWMGTQLAGAVLNVSCDAGFMMSSSAAPACQQEWQITCSDDGLVSGNGETCMPLTCGCGSEGSCPAPSGDNIRSISPAGTLSHGQAFNVTCEEGYRAVDSSAEWSTCSDPKVFSGECRDCDAAMAKRCRPVRCSAYTTDDPNVESWSRPGLEGNEELVTFGQALIVMCKEGYRAGAACAATSCDSSAPNSFSVACGSECTFTAGQECKPVACSDVPGIPNSDSQAPQAVDGRLFGAQVVVTCLEGFMPEGVTETDNADESEECTKELRVQCGADGAWTAGECTPVTCTAPSSGSAAGEVVVLGGNFSTTCTEGYQLSGEGSAWGVCSENCQLQPAVQTCEALQCAPLTEFEANSPASVTAPPLAVTALTVEYPHLITVTCSTGLVADESLTFTPSLPSCSKDLQLQCEADGYFDLVEPATPPRLCVLAECPPFTSVDPNVLPNEATSATITYGTSIQVVCTDGYKPSGSGGNDTFRATCGLRDTTGDACQWRVDQTCEPIVCGRYTPPDRATIEDDQWTAVKEYRLGEQVNLRCPVGYVVAGTTCSKDFVDRCLPSGMFSGAQCNPIVCPPLSQTPPPHPLPAGASRWPDSVPDTSVTFGNSAQIACPSGTKPFGSPPWLDGREVVCGDNCRLEVAETEACMNTMCAPYDLFDFSSGVVHDPYFDNPSNLSFGQNVTVQCMPGFLLDDAVEFTLPGLDDLGSVTVKARRVFAAVDRTQENVFRLDGDFAAVTVVVPPGSWPEGLNEPLSVTVFDATNDMTASFASNSSTLDAETKIAGGVINYGPEGATFDPPIRIALPLDRTVDFGSRILQVHRYDPATRTWTPKEYPANMPNVIDYAAGVVWAETSSFSPYAALALTTVATTTPQPTPAGSTPSPTTAPQNETNATAARDPTTIVAQTTAAPPPPSSSSSPAPPPEEQGGSDVNVPAIVGGTIGGLALLLCGLAIVYVQETRKKEQGGKENLLSQRAAEGDAAQPSAVPAVPPAQPTDQATRSLDPHPGGGVPMQQHESVQGMPALFPPPTPAMAFFPGSDPAGQTYPSGGPAYVSPDQLPWQSPGQGLSSSQMPLLDHEMSAWQPSSPEDVGQSAGLLNALSQVARHPAPRYGDDVDGMSHVSESTLRGTTIDGDPVRGHALEIASELAALIPPGWQLCEGCLQPTKIEWMSCPNCAQPLPHTLA